MNREDNEKEGFWEEVRDLFGHVSGLSEDEQLGFFEKYCGDERVRREVQLLLEAGEKSIRYFSSLEEKLIYPTDDELFDSPPESGRVGNYSIIEKISSGGMGTVYLAERADKTYESQVAIKILHHGLDRDDILGRFHIERQILARLNHPNITHLHDGGITSDGRPYFVMEYVEGLSITDWCNRHKLTCNQRLELYFQVCDALEYAHKNLVIHRDLKPENILVTESGQIKLLDFGIAELLDDEPGDAGSKNKTGMKLMTPEYASPEQIKGEPINTASDVYQMGLVLYQLLCNQPAFDFSGRFLNERERVILDQEPVPPSQRIDETDALKRSEISNQFSLDPVKHKKELKGDLDAIILKALCKEPDMRFSSVSELKGDIVRYMRGLPVESRRGSFGYMAGKYIRRNSRVLTLLSSIVLLLAVLGILHSQSITQERNVALQEAAKSQQIKDFMIDLMQSLDPSELRGEQVSATLLLDRGARFVLESDHQDPEVRGELLLTMAEVYEHLGLLDQSQNLLDALFDHLDTLYEDPSLLGVRGRQQQAFLYSERGEYEDALNLYENVKEMLENIYPSEKGLIAKFYSDYALNFRVMGEAEKADSLLKLSLQMHEAIYDTEDPNLSRVMSRYAAVLLDLGRPEEAKEYNERVLSANRRNFGDVHPRVLTETTNLATTHLLLEEYTAADSLYRLARELSEQLYGPENAVLGIILNNHATVKARLGMYEEALVMQENVLHLRHESGLYQHPSTGMTTLGMSGVLLELKRYDEAYAKAVETLELFGYGLPASHWLYDRARLLLNESGFRMGNYNPEMASSVQGAYDNLKEARGEDDVYTQRAWSLLAEMESAGKDHRDE